MDGPMNRDESRKKLGKALFLIGAACLALAAVLLLAARWLGG